MNTTKSNEEIKFRPLTNDGGDVRWEMSVYKAGGTLSKNSFVGISKNVRKSEQRRCCAARQNIE